MRKVLFVILLIPALLIGAAALVWFRPEILIHEETVRWALRWAEIQAEWEALSFDFDSIGWTAKRVQIQASGACVRMEGTLDSCIRRLDTAFTFSLSRLRPRLTGLERLQLDLAHLTLPPGDEQEGGPLPDLRLPDLAFRLPEALEQLGELRISAGEIRVESKEGPPLLARLEVQKGADQRKAQLQADASQEPDLALKLSGELSLGAEEVGFEGSISGKASGFSLSSPLSLRLSESLRLEAKPRIQPHSLESRLTLDWRRSDLTLHLGPATVPDLWKHGRIGLSGCELHSQLHREEGYPEANRFRCGLRLAPRNRLLPDVTAELKGELGLEPLAPERIGATLALEGASADAMLESRIEGKARTELRLGEGLLDPRIELTGDLKVPSFQAWKKFWEDTPFAVPAPLHVMNGPVEISFSAVHTGGEEGLVGTARLSTRLSSRGQTLALNGGGKLHLESLESLRGRFDGELVLSDVLLEAPPLRLEEPPQLLPDDRFVTAATGRAELPKETGEPQLRWNLRITNEKPVRIATTLTPAPVPLAVNLRVSDDSMLQGTLEVLPMPVQFFRRTAQVERVRLTYEKGAQAGQVDGVLSHRTPEVVIRVHILGSTQSPRIELQSEPPLTQQQILSVLLFNKSLAELTEEEAASTRHMSQAITDGAFGLFSFFFLSATPIEAVGYDPVTQTYSARLRLDQRTTLSVGSDFEGAREFGLRRRIGRRWALRTELRQEMNEPDVVLTLIEWFRRF